MMNKTELERLIDIKDTILQSMEQLDEMKKSQKSLKRADLIHWIIITFGVLLDIGILALII